MTQEQRFRQFIEYRACTPAREWVKNRSLVQAWRDCPNGCWMAYWLIVLDGTMIETTRSIAQQMGIRSFLLGYGLTDEQKLVYADRLRQLYTPGGKERKPWSL